MNVNEPSSELKVRILVVKASSRCNLDCTYCYVYNLGDTTYKSQPREMPAPVMDALFARVRAHALRHKLDHFCFILHGGEPLLLGHDFYRAFVSKAREALSPEVTPIFTMQTNGTLIDDAWCKVLADLDIGIGISLDGPRAVNDRYRVDHAGRGSYDAVIAGLKIAQTSSWTQVQPGILTVIDVESDPVEAYEHLRSLDVRQIDFLLPEATFERPPVSVPGRETPYADWLIAIFDRWFHEKPKRMSLRIFEGIIAQILGMPSPIDSMGQSRNEVLVIEADGGIEPIGSLKICGHGFTKLGANVLTHELDDALSTDLARAYHLSGERLCATCASCPIHEVCGGGYLPHRFSQERGFDNPSVYCKDLLKLITHIQNAILDGFPPQVRSRFGLTRLSYERARSLVSFDAQPRRALPVVRA